MEKRRKVFDTKFPNHYQIEISTWDACLLFVMKLRVIRGIMHACKGCINPGIFKKWKLYAEGKEKVEVDLNFEDILMHMRLTESTLKS